MEKPKRRLFADTKRSHGTVVLNWVGTPEREFKWYGEAYHEAGKTLVEQLKNDPRFGLYGYPPDSFKALPIVYLYRHATELYLKGIILAGAGVLPLRGEQTLNLKTVLNTHSLRQLLHDVERIFEAFGWNWDFEVLDTRIIPDDNPQEVVIRGRLTVHTKHGTIVKEQFGSSAVKRSNGSITSLGDDLKAATSDALKKCASLLGLALDLYES